LQKLVKVGGKIVLTAALFAILISTIPIVQGQSTQPKIVLWSYSYDGENLGITLKCVSDNVTGILLCVRDTSGILIGSPLYYSISYMISGQIRTNSFKIENYSTVKIVFTYEGQQVTEVVNLNKPAPTTYNLSISSSVRWLEADLGGTATYTITLKNAGIAGRFKFIENGLPASISASFYDGSQKILAAMLDEGESKTVYLYLVLPSQALGFETDQSIDFNVYALDENQLAEYENGASLDNIGTWSLDLSVTPVGAPVLSLSLDNVFARTAPGTEVYITGKVANTGSDVADDVTVDVTDLQYGWSAFANPATISSINPDGTANVSITIVLPSDAAPGRYDLSITASSGDKEASKDFEVRVETTSSSPILWIFALIFVFVIIAGIMVKFGRR
jgi:uncharacterized membrane protein